MDGFAGEGAACPTPLPCAAGEGNCTAATKAARPDPVTDTALCNSGLSAKNPCVPAALAGGLLCLAVVAAVAKKGCSKQPRGGASTLLGEQTAGTMEIQLENVENPTNAVDAVGARKPAE